MEAVRAELAGARDAERQAEQWAAAQAEAAEHDRVEAVRELTAVRAEAEALQGRERAAREAADTLRGALAAIKGRGGWRGVLLRLAGVV